MLAELLDYLNCWCYRCQRVKFDRPIHVKRILFRPSDLATIKFLFYQHNTVLLWTPAPEPHSPIGPTAYCSHATSTTNSRTLAWAVTAVFRIHRSACRDLPGTISVARSWCAVVVVLYEFQVLRCPRDLLQSTWPGTSLEVLAAERTPAIPRINSSISVVTFDRRIASRCNASQQRTVWLAANKWCPIVECISLLAETHINHDIIKNGKKTEWWNRVFIPNNAVDCISWPVVSEISPKLFANCSNTASSPACKPNQATDCVPLVWTVPPLVLIIHRFRRIWISFGRIFRCMCRGPLVRVVWRLHHRTPIVPTANWLCCRPCKSTARSRTVIMDYTNADNFQTSNSCTIVVLRSFHWEPGVSSGKFRCDANCFHARPVQWLSSKSTIKLLRTHSIALWISKRSIKSSPKWETIRADSRTAWQMNFLPSINNWNDKKMHNDWIKRNAGCDCSMFIMTHSLASHCWISVRTNAPALRFLRSSDATLRRWWSLIVNSRVGEYIVCHRCHSSNQLVHGTELEYETKQ